MPSTNPTNPTTDQAVQDLKYFVANWFDGSVQRCLELDELLWLVRIANSHREPAMLHPASREKPTPSRTPTLDDL